MSSPTATPKEKKNSEEHSLQLDQNDVEYNNDYSLQKENTEAVLNNPLYGLTRAQLFAKVEKFAADKNLEHEVETLKKGTLVAQNPADFRSIDILTDEERDVIDHEYKSKWAHPLTLYATIFLCSVGAATQGWDQTGSNGANLSFPTEFGISDAATLPDGSVNTQAYNHSWIVGLVNAAPYIASAFLGCWLSDPLNQHFRRRGTIFITALILVITPSPVTSFIL